MTFISNLFIILVQINKNKSNQKMKTKQNKSKKQLIIKYIVDIIAMLMLFSSILYLSYSYINENKKINNSEQTQSVNYTLKSY